MMKKKEQYFMSRKKRKCKSIRASFTVEAAFIMPIVVLLLVWCVSLALDLHTQVKKSAGEFSKVEKIYSVEEFRTLSKGTGIMKSLKGE